MALSLGTRAGRRLRQSGRQRLRELWGNLDAALFREKKNSAATVRVRRRPAILRKKLKRRALRQSRAKKKKKQTMNNRASAVRRSIIKIKLFVIKSYQQPADGTDVAPAELPPPSPNPSPSSSRHHSAESDLIKSPRPFNANKQHAAELKFLNRCWSCHLRGCCSQCSLPSTPPLPPPAQKKRISKAGGGTMDTEADWRSLASRH